MNSRKGIKIRAFGCAMENSLKNYFQCLVIFWKCYFPTNFSHFISFQTNFILENPPPPTHQRLQKIDHYPHKTHHHTTQKPPNHHHPHHHNNNNKKKIKNQREKDWEIEGKRDWSPAAMTIFSVSDEISLRWVKNEIGLGWWRWERDARLRSRWRWRWSTACDRLLRSKFNLYSSVHGWRSERWVLGVCESVIREGWAEMKNRWWVFVSELGWVVMRDQWMVPKLG